MTTLPLTNDEADLAAVAAEAAAKVIPAPEALRPLTPMAATPGLASGFAGAVLAELDELPGRIAVLVGGELVTALSQSPIGGLDLAAALQPTLDAVARTLGTLVVGARAVDPSLVISDLGEDVTAVPLMGREPVAAILLSKAALSAATSPATEPEPALAAAAPAAPAASAFGAMDLGTATAGVPGVVPGAPARRRGIELLHGVDMEVTVEIGRTRMTVREILGLSPGAVLELDRAAGSPADLLVNGRLIARGEVVVIDEDFGLRVTEIVTDTSGF